MKLLLHICCSPCLTYPLEVLKDEQRQTEGFFYNPNIHPREEHERRAASLRAYAAKTGCNVTFTQYSAWEYFKAVAPLPENKRCQYCYYLRLKKTAIFAKINKFDAFSTTLLLSPYQKHDLLAETARLVAGEEGIEFFYRDFRPGYERSRTISREHKLYRQNYCGCVFSKTARIKSKQKRSCSHN